MKTGDVWSSRSFTATGNGFACADGSTGTAVESYAICVSSSSTVPQIGACCPAGSQWSSTQNKCAG